MHTEKDKERERGLIIIGNRQLDKDVYGRCLATAKGYYRMLRRRKEIETQIIHESPTHDGQPKGNGISDVTRRKAEQILQLKAENERKILAVEQALKDCSDDCEREFIKKNLFEQLQMQFIDLPMSIITMKRYRKKFLVRLAENLFEI